MSGNLIATFEEAAPRYDSSGARFAGPVADELVARAGLRKEDVWINLVDVNREDWSFGNGDMQYAPK